MESNGEAGKVNVSLVTKQLLENCYPDMYTFEFNKKV